MADIVNKVAESQLMTFDLEDHYPKGERIVLDIKDWLYEGFILKEKEFRNHVNTHDWEKYEGAYVALNCSTDAIVPGWAYMLIATKLNPFAKSFYIGSLEQLEASIYQDVIAALDLSEYKDRLVIIKGCSNKPVPPNAYLLITSRMQALAKSVMYGEACSSVPLYKRK